MAKKTVSQSSQPQPTESTPKRPIPESLRPNIPLSRDELNQIHDCICAIGEISWLGAHSSLGDACPKTLNIITIKMLDIMEDVENRNPGILNRNLD